MVEGRGIEIKDANLIMTIKEKNSFDVVIVGSGPAGAMASIRLSTKGYRVLVIERERLPRYKACGGGLPLKSVDQIGEIGIDISPVVEKRVDGTRITYKAKDQVSMKTEGIGVMVMRDKFDSFLIGKAEKAGADVRDGEKVTGVNDNGRQYEVVTDKGVYKSDLLIGADGANSTIAKKLGMRSHRELGVAIEREVSVEKWQLEEQGDNATFDFGASPYGYAWIFPKRDHLSIGVYSGVGKQKDLNDYLERFIKDQKVLDGCKTISNVWHPIPWGGAKEVLHKGRAVLAGDAAGLADPFFGEGIAFALKSGSIAANKADYYLTGRITDLKSYSDEIYQQISSDFVYARLIHKIIYFNPWLAHKIFCKNRVVNGYFADVIRGEMSFKELFRKTLYTMPKWIWAY